MPSVPGLASQQLSNTITNVQTWGGVIYNAKTYGAKGDGVTDDTAAIQAAITAAGANGQVIVPGGNYKISAQLNITCNFDAKQATFTTTGTADSASTIIPGVFNITSGKDVWLPTLVKAGTTYAAYNYSDGNLSNLTTTDKSSLVNAVNENVGKIGILSGVGVFVESFPIIAPEADDTARIGRALATLANGGRLIFAYGKTYTTGTFTVSQNNVDLFLDHCTLKTNGITITGSNSGITGVNATIDGRLKIAKLAVQATNGATSLTLDSMPFVVGDGIQSSYGLGSDGSDPISIQSINGNTVTIPATFVSSKSGQTQNSVSATIPVNAYIGNFTWSTTVSLQGNGSYLKGLTPLGLNIINSRGYALSAKGTNIQTYVDNVFINNNGLDILQVATSATLNMTNSKIGFIYDIAKQGIVLGDGTTNQSPIVNADHVTFNRQNSDPDFFFNGTMNGAEIHVKYCTLIGTGGVHPAGANNYNANSYAVIPLTANTGSTIAKIEFVGCVLQDYEQGIITEQSGNTVAQSIGEVYIKDCKAYNAVLGNYTHTTWTNHFDIEDSLFDGQSIKSSSVWWISNGNSIINMKRTKFINDQTTKNFTNFFMHDMEFENAPLAGNETTHIERISLENSPISTYPSYDNSSIMRIKDVTIHHNSMTTAAGGDITSVFNLLPASSGAGAPIDFRFKKGTLSGKIYNQGYKNYYIVMAKLWGTSFNPGYSLLYGDDWNIPVNSQIENLSDTSSARFHYVTKSNVTTLSATAAANATTITVASATGIAANDYINIALDNGRVWSTKVGSGYTTGTSIPLVNALPSQASSGNNVCDFLYS